MKTILCVTDSLAGSEKAVNYITELIQPVDTRFILFHSKEPVAATVSDGSNSHLRLMDELDERNEYIELLEELKKRLQVIKPSARIRYDIQIRHGFVQETVPALVQKEQIDLVVLANEEAGDNSEKSADMLAAHIRKNTSCPVLVASPQLSDLPGYKATMTAAPHKMPYTGTELFTELSGF